MIETIKKLLGIGPKVSYSELVANGAIIVDVRTKGEFQGGHIKGSINIPLDSLRNNLTKIKKNKPVITCCASGARSASAKMLLKSSGYSEVYNGGSWMRLQNKI
ncbi:MAG: rhodanese-like domain-containing protein [Bacteroidota bacterium]|nr:rhodanese-like domain-containing protein [Bacteroidota bacterium]